MKRTTTICLLLILSLFFLTSCGAKSEETDPEAEIYAVYTSEMMISEIENDYGVDVSSIVKEYDVSKMTASEKKNLMIYLYNYAHYKNLTIDEFISDFKSLSPESLDLLIKDLENCNFENLDADEKINIGQTLSEEYAFYDSTEEDAISMTSSVYGESTSAAKNLLEENGYFTAADKKEKSKILYKLLVLNDNQ